MKGTSRVFRIRRRVLDFKVALNKPIRFMPFDEPVLSEVEGPVLS
ncbi:protein of unknown function [Methylocaldum szegediense]|uniref:Uncharacterized protein n=1 Tax=Methylocaldum szegediense TaxID=73780 RepID=A0ABN8X9J7_9GAMM|nr:protein of unknown function [Methylocaldum szegediense]